MNWNINPETMGLAMLAAGDAAAMLSGVNPSLFTIRAFRRNGAHSERTARDIHTGMVIGSTLALAVGYGASLVTNSFWPLAVTLATLAILDGAYEWALRNPAGLHDSIAAQ